MAWQQAFPVFWQPPSVRPIGEIDQEIRDELEFHVEMRTRANVAAGMSAAAARQDAVRRFGDWERIRKTCRQTLLGERIMLQRVQTALTAALLVAVVVLGAQFYRSQRANEEAASRMTQALDALAQKAESDVSSAAPTVVQTAPQSGDRGVDPSLTEIRVTYNKPMMDRSWSWCHDPEQLQTSGEPHYEADGRTCVLPVKLEPGKTYTIMLNSKTYGNFKDAAGRSAVPYVLQFHTRQEKRPDGAAKP